MIQEIMKNTSPASVSFQRRTEDEDDDLRTNSTSVRRNKDEERTNADYQINTANFNGK